MLWIELYPPAQIILKPYPSILGNVTLFENRVFTGLIKLRYYEDGHSFIGINWSPCKKKKIGHRHKRTIPYEDRGEIGVMHNKPRDAKDCYPPPEASSEAWNRLSRSFRRNNPANTCVLDFQAPHWGRTSSIILSQTVCGILLCSPRKLVCFVYSVNSDTADIHLFYVSLGKLSYNISSRKRYMSKLEKGPYKVYF